MKFSFTMGVYLVLATTVATLVAIGGAYQLSVTERGKQADAEAQSQHELWQRGKMPRSQRSD